jgi:hypothetical protein
MYFGESPPPAADAGPPDRGPAPGCLTEAQRTQPCRVDVSLRAVDFTTLAPRTDLAVAAGTAWDTTPPLIPECLTLAAGTTDASGRWTLVDLRCDSWLLPPIVAVSLGGRAVVDRGLTCRNNDCGAVDFGDVPVLDAALEASWRQEMQDDGMANAATRGLAIFDYREPDGTSAAGVIPFQAPLAGGERTLAPGPEVRFVAADRLTLVRGDAAMTGASGLAIVALDGTWARIGGQRGTDRWQPLGVAFAAWVVFLEDERLR